MKTAVPSTDIVVALLRREIDRFIQAARVRCEFDADTRRRALRRYHRSWPLLVSDEYGSKEVSAALHDASPNGIGFLCNRPYPLDGLILVKLFWHESASPRVPALVRHVTPHRDATLVGCQFALDDQEACHAAVRARRWYS